MQVFVQVGNSAQKSSEFERNTTQNLPLVNSDFNSNQNSQRVPLELPNMLSGLDSQNADYQPEKKVSEMGLISYASGTNIEMSPEKAKKIKQGALVKNTINKDQDKVKISPPNSRAQNSSNDYGNT